MPVKLNSSGGGSVTLDVPVTASTFTLNLPAQSGSVVAANSSGNVGIGTTSPAAPLDVVSNTNGVAYRLRARSSDEFGLIEFVNNAGSSAHGYIGTPLANTLTFYTSGLNERMRISSTGNVGIGTASPSTRLHVFETLNQTTTLQSGTGVNFLNLVSNNGGGNFGSQIRFLDGATDSANISSVASGGFLIGTLGANRAAFTINGQLALGSTSEYSDGTIGAPRLQFNALAGNYVGAVGIASTTALITHIAFRNPNGLVGTIQTSGTSTSYNTSSDYRLKENVVPLTGASARVQALKPRRFNFITDPNYTLDGFLAHEAAEVVPEAVSGEKDAINKDGEPVYQGIDQSKLVPLLTAALQEALSRIDALEARLSAVEAR